jgi:hypothetical protein
MDSMEKEKNIKRVRESEREREREREEEDERCSQEDDEHFPLMLFLKRV